MQLACLSQSWTNCLSCILIGLIVANHWSLFLAKTIFLDHDHNHNLGFIKYWCSVQKVSSSHLIYFLWRLTAKIWLCGWNNTVGPIISLLNAMDASVDYDIPNLWIKTCTIRGGLWCSTAGMDYDIPNLWIKTAMIRARFETDSLLKKRNGLYHQTKFVVLVGFCPCLYFLALLLFLTFQCNSGIVAIRFNIEFRSKYLSCPIGWLWVPNRNISHA